MEPDDIVEAVRVGHRHGDDIGIVLQWIDTDRLPGRGELIYVHPIWELRL